MNRPRGSKVSSLLTVLFAGVALAVVYLLFVSARPLHERNDLTRVAQKHRVDEEPRRRPGIDVQDVSEPPAPHFEEQQSNVFTGEVVLTIRGDEVPLNELYGHKVTLIVNVASHCGFTAVNYFGLERLQRKFAQKGFTVLAFPSNQFGHQEPGPPEVIERYVREVKHATFPLFAKSDVNGGDTLPLYRKLKAALHVPRIEWNFGKFLVVNGQPVRYFPHTTPFLEIEREIVRVLARS